MRRIFQLKQEAMKAVVTGDLNRNSFNKGQKHYVDGKKLSTVNKGMELRIASQRNAKEE